MTPGPAPGWYPDPDTPAGGLVRWWNGTQWTGQAQPTTPPGNPTQFTPGMYRRGMYGGRGTGRGRMPLASQSFTQRNQASLTAIGISAAYVLIALTVHFVFFGIFPAMMCFRAFNRHEPLAIAALVAAALAIGVAVLSYT